MAAAGRAVGSRGGGAGGRRRNVPLWGPEAGWVGAVLRRYHERDPAQRLISVLQGWNVTEAELATQIDQSHAGDSAGYLVAGMAIDQSFWPVERS
jgi:hypothetical protein